MRAPPFNPAIPTGTPDVKRFATMVTDHLNRPYRNEFTVGVSVPGPSTDLARWTADLTYVAPRMAGWSPYFEELVLRRVRIGSATVKARSFATTAGVTIRALIQNGAVEAEVGEFSSFDFALPIGSARVISGPKDVDVGLLPGAIFTVEAEYKVYPPVDFSDTVVLFDIGVI